MKLIYRPEIDGLRAIAVGAVVLYHGEITVRGESLFSGGFLGVDVFFVISGYLISSLILREINETSRFSITAFYERRARRILPMLFLVVGAAFPAAWFFMPPSDFVEMSKSALSAMLFSSNFFFHLSSLDYSGIEASLRPLLHTWSLSVEEQFYIVFPFVFLFLFKYLKYKIKYIFVFSIILVLIFVYVRGTIRLPLSIGGVDFSFDMPSEYFSFYMPFGRAWELLAGSLLAVMELERGRPDRHSGMNTLLSLLGVGLIFSSIVFARGGQGGQPLFALAAVCGACLVIWFCSTGALATRLLSSKPLVGVGLVSYSLYLWHFPVFVFAQYASFYREFGLIALILISGGLSVLSYFLVEAPFRNRQRISRSRLVLVLSGIGVWIISANALAVYKGGFSQRFSDVLVMDGIHIDNQYYTDERAAFETANKPTVFSGHATTKVLIVGNSHGQDFFNAFILNKDKFPKVEFSLSVVVYAESLRTYFETQRNCHEPGDDPEEQKFCQADIILISTRWDGITPKILETIASAVESHGKRLILTTNTPHFETFARRTILDKFIMVRRRLPVPEEELDLKHEYYANMAANEFVANINSLLEKFSKKHGIELLDKVSLLCDPVDGTCDVFTDDRQKIIYDYGHYTLAGAKYVGKKIHALGVLKAP